MNSEMMRSSCPRDFLLARPQSSHLDLWLVSNRSGVRTHMWLQLAAATGDKDATLNAELVARQMTPPQLEQVQRLARDWQARKPRAAR